MEWHVTPHSLCSLPGLAWSISACVIFPNTAAAGVTALWHVDDVRRIRYQVDPFIGVESEIGDAASETGCESSKGLTKDVAHAAWNDGQCYSIHNLTRLSIILAILSWSQVKRRACVA